MINTNKIHQNQIKNINQRYIQKRKEIIKVIKSTSLKLYFNSQTFFYAIYYLDLIFLKENTITKLSDFIAIGLSCLSLSAKYNENDPAVPEIKRFISALADVTRFRYRFSLETIIQSEIFCLKMLNYNLNHYSLYHFLGFFFTHGLVLNNFEIKKPNEELVLAKKLEKIYILSREMIDYLLEEECMFLGDDSMLIAVAILRKSIEVNFSNSKNVKDVFSDIYKIDDQKERYIKIKKLAQQIYDLKILKKDPGKISILQIQKIQALPKKNLAEEQKKIFIHTKNTFDGYKNLIKFTKKNSFSFLKKKNRESSTKIKQSKSFNESEKKKNIKLIPPK